MEIAVAMDQETSTLSVHEGAADVVWQDQTTVVPAGYMVSFDPTHPPSQPVPLPKPPTLVSPVDGRSFRFRAAPPRVSFSWQSIDETKEFRVQIARDPRFDEIVYEDRHSRTAFVHGNLGEGTYHWRVSGLRGRIASVAGKAGTFTIKRDQEAPRLSVEFPSGPVTERTLTIRGETEPGCRVVVGAESVPTDPAGRFELTVALKSGYNFLVVQAIDAAGNTAFQNHTVVAELKDSEKEP